MRQQELIPLQYYLDKDPLFLSRNLLGKYLLTNIDNVITGGMIVETEAYCAPEDKASHAYKNRRTKRNAAMYAAGGISYVYQCYGIHALFNIVTNEKDIPHAILIRAIQPEIGIDTMLQRRNKSKLDRSITGGPGALTQALGINIKHNGISLTSSILWLEDRGKTISNDQIIASPRVGVDYAGEDAKNPWRYRILNNPWTSPAK